MIVTFICISLIFVSCAKAQENWKDFVASGKMDNMPLMAIDIQGFGPISFPIYSEKIFKLIKPYMISSSFGLPNERIYDANIRISSELKAGQLKIINSEWDNYLINTILPKIGHELGFNHSTTEAHLDKMLLYETGSFFGAHIDGSKVDGNFGTLIIQLPSKFSGGQFKTSYNGLEKIFDYSTPSEISVNGDSEIYGTNQFHGFYSALYLGVQHEVTKLTSGYRICLLYNLVDKSRQIDRSESELKSGKSNNII